MIQQVSISDVKKNPTNPRTIKDNKFKQLVKSIQEFPEMLKLRPIVVNDDMVVLGGNMRLKACESAGLKQVFIIKASNLTEEQQKEFIIKDNTGYGEWDWKTLQEDWNFDLLKDWGLDIPSYIKPNKKATDDGYEIPEHLESKIKLGDFIEIGSHKLLCGSATNLNDIKKLMGEQKADMVFTDPPYNVAYTGGTKDKLTIKNDEMDRNSFTTFMKETYHSMFWCLKSGSPFYIWHSSRFVDCFINPLLQNPEAFYTQTLIWVKSLFVMGRSDYHYRHEPCLYGWKKGEAHKFYGARNLDTIYEQEFELEKLSKEQLLQFAKSALETRPNQSVVYFDKPQRSSEHPTMKPIELCGHYIGNSSQENELILDLFLGSGSTMVAAHQMGRICYGTELDPHYCDVIIDRMRLLDPSLIVKINGKHIS